MTSKRNVDVKGIGHDTPLGMTKSNSSMDLKD